MSEPLATYSFLPWLRQGIANNITQTDNDTSVFLRASINIRLSVGGTKPDGTALAGQNIDQIVELYGPGDIIGIDSKAIIKTEPHNWITNFEPNYLPYIDFYEEDFPWRYTPAAPTGDRLRPWLMLVVLKEEEFEDGSDMTDKPLPFFKLKEEKYAIDLFPLSSELWAWAHVHVNTDLSKDAPPNAANANDVRTEISNIISENPDLAYSRIICPRKLESNVGYHAFLIPTFESGRLAGLGREIPASLVATTCCWDAEENTEFPYYHRWYFRTGNVGDFEYLVNLLKPKPADKSVGVRDIDVLHPGSNLPPISNTDLNGILKLGGAMRVPFDSMTEEDQLQVKKYDEWDEHPYPHPFTEAMAQRINLSDEYTGSNRSVADINQEAGITLENDDGDPDPVITSPLYGRWHALQNRLLKDNSGEDLPHNKNWIHELNLDPRFRVAAGLGTKVVQKKQEEYMQAAWEQVGKIIEANNKIRLSQMAKEVTARLYELQLIPMLNEKAFVFAAPVHKRLMYQNLTVFGQVNESVIPPALTSGTFRSITRPRGAVMKKLAFNESITPSNIVVRVNDGDVVIVPPKEDPIGAIKLADLEQDSKPKNIPPVVENHLKKYPWFKYLPLIILLIVLILLLLFFRTTVGLSVSGILAAGLILSYLRLKKWDNDLNNAAAVSQSQQTPEAVDQYPTSPDFTITSQGTNVTPSPGNSDSEEASRFKAALREAFELVNTKFPDPVRKKLDLNSVVTNVMASINPEVTITKRTFEVIKLPAHIKENLAETFAPVMAYPEIDVPMYKPLADMSTELFLPNLNNIEPNSITLLENNQKFIEAYMVGVNHEMSRELLWRAFPTDQRGTYFRQFWDVNSFLPPQPVAADLKEKLRDVPPIHKWSKVNSSRLNPGISDSPLKNELGTHNQRATEGGKTPLILVIRGELLKKYPTAVVYAQKADWGIKNGIKDITVERVLLSLTSSELQNPPLTKFKTPLFEAKIEPDIYFFGFDLDDEEARGALEPTGVSDDAGWFFVLKERPGEPRFGLDIEKTKTESGVERIINWNNLSWLDIETEDGACIELTNTITFNSYNDTIDQENEPTPDDVQARWSPTTNSAELAYILYQVPVMVAVHASRMLPK